MGAWVSIFGGGLSCYCSSVSPLHSSLRPCAHPFFHFSSPYYHLLFFQLFFLLVWQAPVELDPFTSSRYPLSFERSLIPSFQPPQCIVNCNEEYRPRMRVCITSRSESPSTIRTRNLARTCYPTPQLPSRSPVPYLYLPHPPLSPRPWHDLRQPPMAITMEPPLLHWKPFSPPTRLRVTSPLPRLPPAPVPPSHCQHHPQQPPPGVELATVTRLPIQCLEPPPHGVVRYLLEP